MNCDLTAFSLFQVWAYLHLPVLRRGILERPGLVPIARCWDSRCDTHTLSDQLASLQDAIDSYPQLDVVWRPYLEEGDEGQPWLVQARPYFEIAWAMSERDGVSQSRPDPEARSEFSRTPQHH
ncbi:hypothetical protein Taro_052288 [Colocasia esculenta]|uniref:Uncharacterized protein n=1 Tax=Colocasia esculenta TaxID=4460 RepID=A0A843XJS4_COLES|nr:hypothetical protein [Colocasia esculenta]